MAFHPRIPAPPTLSGSTARLTEELQSLSNWNRQLWTAFVSLPRLSWFSGVSPNLSRLTGVQGDIAINIGSASTVTVMWVMAGTGSASTTSGWMAVPLVAVP